MMEVKFDKNKNTVVGCAIGQVGCHCTTKTKSFLVSEADANGIIAINGTDGLEDGEIAIVDMWAREPSAGAKNQKGVALASTATLGCTHIVFQKQEDNQDGNQPLQNFAVADNCCGPKCFPKVIDPKWTHLVFTGTAPDPDEAIEITFMYLKCC